jgi:phosphoribosylglycinamide formyltransferase-1
MSRPLPIAILVSGEGTTMDALAETIQGGRLPARVTMVVADRAHTPAIERARHRGLPTEVLPLRGTSEEAWSHALDRLLRDRRVELVVLAGFLSVVPADFVRAWEGRIINLHPSLLPKYGGKGFYGTKVLDAIIAAGESEAGVSIHLVTAEVDRGPVIEQRRFPIGPGETSETLRERLRPYEVAALEAVLRRFADGIWPLPYRQETAPPPTHGT